MSYDDTSAGPSRIRYQTTPSRDLTWRALLAQRLRGFRENIVKLLKDHDINFKSD